MRTILTLALLGAGASTSLSAGCASAAPPPQAGPKPAGRAEGVVLTGDPKGGTAIASCDATGRWQAGGASVDHWIYEPETKRRVAPMDVGRSFSLFRGSLPFPYFSWQPSEFQINQLVYPVGDGFAAMYHVMNHGENAKACRLFVGLAGDAGKVDGRSLRSEGKPVLTTADAMSTSKDGDGGRPSLAFDLLIEPGTSKFIFVTTPDLDGKVPQDALDLAAASWERKLGERRLVVPDKALMTSYYADLAGAALGVAGCAENAAKVEAKLVRKEGDALRLFPELPESWVTEAIEAVGIATPFGPLALKYEGAFNTPSYELGADCKPPGGFLIKFPEKLKAKIDGKPAEAVDGFLRVPAGSRKVETVRASE